MTFVTPSALLNLIQVLLCWNWRCCRMWDALRWNVENDYQLPLPKDLRRFDLNGQWVNTSVLVWCDECGILNARENLRGKKTEELGHERNITHGSRQG
ncbi:hypothetical protein PROFUN_00154 [Planoprotostelium fungivorum]|uniref:Uncharacterized protein n=1 Tax=Planoprotostelium fungivorum TaxID=1890364 RepID=A0A2P6P0S2_9EUKA|nr:hypothetical protein PROFUN_00154 [Planoprotostelium fungivorum]